MIDSHRLILGGFKLHMVNITGIQFSVSPNVLISMVDLAFDEMIFSLQIVFIRIYVTVAFHSKTAAYLFVFFLI